MLFVITLNDAMNRSFTLKYVLFRSLLLKINKSCPPDADNIFICIHYQCWVIFSFFILGMTISNICVHLSFRVFENVGGCEFCVLFFFFPLIC